MYIKIICSVTCVLLPTTHATPTHATPHTRYPHTHYPHTHYTHYPPRTSAGGDQGRTVEEQPPSGTDLPRPYQNKWQRKNGKS